MMDANSSDSHHQNSHHHDKRRRPLKHAKPAFRKQNAVQNHSTSSEDSGDIDRFEESREARIVANKNAGRISYNQTTNSVIMNDNNNQSQPPEPLPRTQIKFNVTDDSSVQPDSTSNNQHLFSAPNSGPLITKTIGNETQTLTQSPSTSDTLVDTNPSSTTDVISSRNSQNIPNVFFSRLNTIDDGDDEHNHQKKFMETQSSVDLNDTLTPFDGDCMVTRSPKSSEDQPIKYSNLPRIPSIQMLNADNHYNDGSSRNLSQDLASKSASSSPRIGRQNRSRAVCAGQLIESLIVPPASLGRKLSLQPLGNQMKGFTGYRHHLQTSPIVSGLGNQNNSLHQNALSSTSIGSVANSSANPSSTNNLTVNSNHLVPRKSVIGRLERSSFQTQRLSDVGVAFGQQLTAKMGLKLPASQERIVEQTRWLYLRYVFVKLRQNALPLRDLNLTKSSRARRAAALGESTVIQTNMPEKLVSSSAPTTAATINTDVITSPFNSGSGAGSSTPGGGGSNGKLSCRKRTAITHDINTQDLAMLTAKLRNEECTPSSTTGGNIYDSGTNSTGVDHTPGLFSASGGGSAASNKKFIMDPTINNQIFTVIWNIIRELRELKPEFYGDTIYELIGMEKFSSIQTLLDVQMTLCQEMTRSEISWCRITALFSLFGAMSLDCVRMGTPEHVGPILDGFIEFVERDLALWISQQGGWESFLYKYRPGFRINQLASKIITIALPVFVWIILSMFKSSE